MHQEQSDGMMMEIMCSGSRMIRRLQIGKGLRHVWNGWKKEDQT